MYEQIKEIDQFRQLAGYKHKERRYQSRSQLKSILVHWCIEVVCL